MHLIAAIAGLKHEAIGATVLEEYDAWNRIFSKDKLIIITHILLQIYHSIHVIKFPHHL